MLTSASLMRAINVVKTYTDFLMFQVRMAIVNNYKDSRLLGRFEEYANMVIDNAYKEEKEIGKFTIGSFESKSGLSITCHLDNSNILIES